MPKLRQLGPNPNIANGTAVRNGTLLDPVMELDCLHYTIYDWNATFVALRCTRSFCKHLGKTSDEQLRKAVTLNAIIPIYIFSHILFTRLTPVDKKDSISFQENGLSVSPFLRIIMWIHPNEALALSERRKTTLRLYFYRMCNRST